MADGRGPRRLPEPSGGRQRHVEFYIDGVLDLERTRHSGERLDGAPGLDDRGLAGDVAVVTDAEVKVTGLAVPKIGRLPLGLTRGGVLGTSGAVSKPPAKLTSVLVIFLVTSVRSLSLSGLARPLAGTILCELGSMVS